MYIRCAKLYLLCATEAAHSGCGVDRHALVFNLSGAAEGVKMQCQWSLERYERRRLIVLLDSVGSL